MKRGNLLTNVMLALMAALLAVLCIRTVVAEQEAQNQRLELHGRE